VLVRVIFCQIQKGWDIHDGWRGTRRQGVSAYKRDTKLELTKTQSTLTFLAVLKGDFNV
jgi:hypothetical protein